MKVVGIYYLLYRHGGAALVVRYSDTWTRNLTLLWRVGKWMCWGWRGERMILSRSRGGFVPVSSLVMNFTNKLAAAAPRCCHQQKQIWGNGGGELETTATLTSPGPRLGLGLAHGYCNMGSTVTCHGRYADDMI